MTNEHTEVLAANEAFYRAFEKKDISAMSGVWSQGTGSLCIHPGRNVLRGWKAISESWEQIFKNTSYIEVETEIIATEVRKYCLHRFGRNFATGKSQQKSSGTVNGYEYF